ncbi:TIGR04197 family type VII secretion effector [Streptococcus suis]|uniref:TIGR04197 family type VII secretion effector n=2 Tax=Streptococcus TaxID=1301 RepID=A0A4T2GKS9_STRSU|nr:MULTISPECIES: TIGR04197 family type VII secretion effector [Streptococcus]MBL6503059.1 TIGR04197 family type VII secretion effector [Streptococcus suis]MBL6538032.1 TIGR04197 family type VII secretion effector [Streptococcus suis]MBM0241726.1 TIGR04197 family type VII secretion effector [Streptococcus suis]MBM7203793.1 TIGR04197 family type VII secretion effector [Streptococcus suis]MBM7270183.1 TIGR04197 family type VII secretion effector [Streptococcus suis]
MIQSNSQIASQVATGIATSASNISGIGMATKDGVSSYNGNNDASTHISREKDYSTQVSHKLVEFVSLVQSMAAEFEAVDQSISRSLDQLVPSGGGQGAYSGGGRRLLTD